MKLLGWVGLCAMIGGALLLGSPAKSQEFEMTPYGPRIGIGPRYHHEWRHHEDSDRDYWRWRHHHRHHNHWDDDED